VIGLGKLGLPLAILLAKSGYQVTGFDLSEKRIIDILNLNIEPEPKVLSMLEETLQKNLSVTSNINDSFQQSEMSFLIVPTPSNEEGEFVNTYLESAIELIIENSKVPNHIICVVSTVMPGTCEYFEKEFIPSKINNSKTKFRLAYSPEFVALGTVIDNMQWPDMVLLGVGEENVASTLLPILTSFALNNPQIKVMSLASAEIAKISVNTFVTAKISYANMIAELSDKIPGANKYDILEALGADSRIGVKYLNPGLGFGGPCFPRDNKAFAKIGDSLNVDTELAKATHSINLRQPKISAQRINAKYGKKHKTLTLLGLAYKPGSFVTEESQAVMLVKELSGKWNRIYVHDPLVNDSGLFLGYSNVNSINSVSQIQKSDLVVVAVNWKEYEEFIKVHPKENLYFV
jgi:UDPglucose 6-dehydrogenase